MFISPGSLLLPCLSYTFASNLLGNIAVKWRRLCEADGRADYAGCSQPSFKLLLPPLFFPCLHSQWDNICSILSYAFLCKLLIQRMIKNNFPKLLRTRSHFAVSNMLPGESMHCIYSKFVRMCSSEDWRSGSSLFADTAVFADMDFIAKGAKRSGTSAWLLPHVTGLLVPDRLVGVWRDFIAS